MFQKNCTIADSLKAVHHSILQYGKELVLNAVKAF